MRKPPRGIFYSLIWFVSALTVLSYIVFVHPRDDKIYNHYKAQTHAYNWGELEIILVNENKANRVTDHFFRVSLKMNPEFAVYCKSSDLHWEIMESISGEVFYSTKTGLGTLENVDSFQNKINNRVFKGSIGAQLGNVDVPLRSTLKRAMGAARQVIILRSHTP